jgi:hypothetical protein
MVKVRICFTFLIPPVKCILNILHIRAEIQRKFVDKGSSADGCKRGEIVKNVLGSLSSLSLAV